MGRLGLGLSLIFAAILAPQRPPASSSTSSADTIRAPHAEIIVAPLDEATGSPVLRVTIRPRAGIHIYAPGQRGYYPVALTLAPDAGLTAGRVDLPTPEPYVFAPTGEKFRVYQQPFTLTQHTRRARGGAPIRRVRATLRYQACDAEVCYRPVELPIVFVHARDAGEKR